MKDIVFRIALNSLENDYSSKSKAEIQQAIYKGLDLIKNKKIRKLNDFYTYIKESGIGQKQFADAVTDIVKEGKPERIIQLGLFLGEGLKGSGVDLLQKPWWKRNLPDEDLRKKISPQWWVLFRDKNWIENNKVTKD